MDYGSWWANAPVPQPHHAAYDAAAHHHLNPPLDHHQYHQQQTFPQSSPYFPSYYPNPNPNPNPRSDPILENPVPDAPHLGFESLYAAAAAPSSYPGFAPPSYYGAGGGGGAHGHGVKEAVRLYGVDPQPSPYYGALGGGGDAHGLAAKEAIRQYGMDPQSYGVRPRSFTGPEPTAQPHQNPTYWNNNVKHHAPRQAPWKHAKSTTKVVQSAYCEVCKINCDTQGVLKIHKQGKKHKRNLLKLQEAITAKIVKVPTTAADKGTPAADKGKAVGEERKKRAAAAAPATEEELELKKQRVLEGGASSGEIKVCTVCNVVVNSQKVFEFHIAGQKHAAMVEKQQAVAPVG